MASQKPSSAGLDHRSARAPVAAPAADTAANPRQQVPRAYGYEPFLPLLYGAASRIVLRLSRGDGLAEVAFPDLNLVLLVLSLRRFHLSPPGSAARRWARFAVWVLTSSITVGFAWGLAAPLNLPSAAVMWAIAAAGVGFSLYLLVFH